ncbi:serine/threonine-protein kinase [Streptomyces sp. NPDC005385]|uniref:serine/threonine-protein kinase n=1 Tax=Streptomyces sp. NPDC005385 TaxID=3157039 RepID=UPI0033A4BA60
MGLRDSARAVVSRCSVDVLGGRYRLDGLLGSGGAADVYRGFDLRLERSVAVKVFRPDSGFGMQESSHDEAIVLARLNHSGLVTAYDAGQHQDRTFLVMQLIEGTTLKHRIAEDPLSVAETAVLGAGLAHALTHAHDASIVHRDVKPSNILLDEASHPYLTDFGISRLLDTTTRTATGTLIGTAAYLSPEQVLGQPVGRPADVYALGLVLLECLTGRPEYDGAPLEAAIARLHRKPVAPEDLPRQLADLLQAMTALDANDRPTALDCAHVMAKAGEQASTAVRPSLHAVGAARDLDQDSRADAGTRRAPFRRNERSAGPASARRRRSMAVGAGSTLVAITAITLVVSGNSGTQDRNPSDARPTVIPRAVPTREETAAAKKSPVRGDDEGRGRDASTSHSPSVPDELPASENDAGKAAPARTTPGRAGMPGATGNDRAAAAKAYTPPGQAKKATKAPQGPKGAKGS